MRRPTVLLADDHTIVTAALRCLLEPDFELVGTVEDGRALVAAAERLRPDVVITDISMPLLNGLEAIRKLKKARLQTKIVLLTMHEDVEFATEAFEAGAAGYLLKQSAAEELPKAIREVLRGHVYVTPLVAKDVLQAMARGTRRPERLSVKLTVRQREVLQLAAEGRSIKEIAAILDISPRTVEFHKYTIMQKLGLRTSADLTQYAAKRGLLAS